MSEARAGLESEGAYVMLGLWTSMEGLLEDAGWRWRRGVLRKVGKAKKRNCVGNNSHTESWYFYDWQRSTRFQKVFIEVTVNQ